MGIDVAIRRILRVVHLWVDPTAFVIQVVYLAGLPLTLVFWGLNDWWFPLSIYPFIPVLKFLALGSEMC